MAIRKPVFEVTEKECPACAKKGRKGVRLYIKGAGCTLRRRGWRTEYKCPRADCRYLEGHQRISMRGNIKTKFC